MWKIQYRKGQVLEIRGLTNSIFGRPNLENAVFEKLKPLKIVLAFFMACVRFQVPFLQSWTQTLIVCLRFSAHERDLCNSPVRRSHGNP